MSKEYFETYMGVSFQCKNAWEAHPRLLLFTLWLHSAIFACFAEKNANSPRQKTYRRLYRQGCADDAAPLFVDEQTWGFAPTPT